MKKSAGYLKKKRWIFEKEKGKKETKSKVKTTLNTFNKEKQGNSGGFAPLLRRLRRRVKNATRRLRRPHARWLYIVFCNTFVFWGGFGGGVSPP